MQKPGEVLLRILCVSISAVLLVMSLLYGVRLTALNQEAAAVKAAVESLKEENEILRVRCASRWSLPEIERYAREELGMQQLSAEQIVKTDFAG